MNKSLKTLSVGLALILIVSAMSGCSFNLDFSKKAEIQKADGVSKTTVSAGTETRLGSVKENGCELTIGKETFSENVEIEIISASDLLPSPESLRGFPYRKERCLYEFIFTGCGFKAALIPRFFHQVSRRGGDAECGFGRTAVH